MNLSSNSDTIKKAKLVTRIIHKIIILTGLDDAFAFYGQHSSFLRKLCPQPSYYEPCINKLIHRNGALFWLSPSDYMQWHIYSSQPEYSHSLAYKYLADVGKRKCLNILDCGANVGGFSLRLGALASDNKLCINIIAFEPNPTILKRLEYNISLNNFPGVSIYADPSALGNKSSTISLSINKSNSGASTISNTACEKLEILCQQITLDDYVATSCLDSVELIKIDVEGYEPFVLQGGEKIINRYKPILYIEITPRWFSERGCDTARLLRKIENLGYTIFYDDDGELVDLSSISPSRLPWQYNILCIPE